MSAPREEVEGCRQAHIKLRKAIAGLIDEQVASASLLGGRVSLDRKTVNIC